MNYWERVEAVDWIESPNYRRGGLSGMKCLKDGGEESTKLFCKYQENHFYKSFRYPWKRLTLLREFQANQAFRKLGIVVPEIVFCDTQKKNGKNVGLMVTRELNGYVSLEEWYQTIQDHPERQAARQQFLETLARVLRHLHHYRWSHGCLYNKHIYVRLDENKAIHIALIDLEKARKRWNFQRASKRDIAQLKRHNHPMPEEDWQDFLKCYYAT